MSSIGFPVDAVIWPCPDVAYGISPAAVGMPYGLAEAAAAAAYICCKYGFDVVDWAAEGGILKKLKK